MALMVVTEEVRPGWQRDRVRQLVGPRCQRDVDPGHRVRGHVPILK